MPIDLYQLPIPDWGLCCPRCEYPLKHLPSHRCPECGSTLDMAAIIPTWARIREPRFTGAELPLPDFGLHCRACQAPVAGAAQLTCPLCGKPFELAAPGANKPWFVLDPDMFAPLPFALAESILAAEDVPFLVREGLTAFGLSRRDLLLPSEFYFECLWLIQRARQRIATEQERAEDDEWHCQQCGEENPPGFETCWNCSTERES